MNNWFARRIHRYEQRRWKTDDNRLVRPFAWGLEHIGGPTDHPNPPEFLRNYARAVLDDSHSWYAVTPASDYRLDSENVLTFTSSIESPWPENNTVHARLWPASRSKARPSAGLSSGHGFSRAAEPAGTSVALATEDLAPDFAAHRPAVLVLPNWNAKWHGQDGLCEWLQRLGITALKMSLPYHNRRMARGHERADQICGPNIGLTLQANRQAVQDARRCLRWLEQQGYTSLGILGTSIGSSVGYITMVHDEAVRAGGFFHVST